MCSISLTIRCRLKSPKLTNVALSIDEANNKIIVHFDEEIQNGSVSKGGRLFHIHLQSRQSKTLNQKEKTLKLVGKKFL